MEMYKISFTENVWYSMWDLSKEDQRDYNQSLLAIKLEKDENHKKRLERQLRYNYPKIGSKVDVKTCYVLNKDSFKVKWIDNEQEWEIKVKYDEEWELLRSTKIPEITFIG